MHPFELGASDIGQLPPAQFDDFVQELLRAEIVSYGGNVTDLRITTDPGADGGADVSTLRSFAQTSTADSLIPVGETVWQLKAEGVEPSLADMKKELKKERPRAVLGNGDGHYRLVAQEPGVEKKLEKARANLVSAMRAAKFSQAQGQFLAKSDLAHLSRRHPSLVLRPYFDRRLKGLQSFRGWEATHRLSFVSVSREPELEAVAGLLRSARPFSVRVVGPTGVGKSRLVLEAVRRTGVEASVVYADSPSAMLDEFWATLREGDRPCILVIDECDEAVAAKLRDELLARGLPVGLVSLGRITPSDAPSGPHKVHLQPLAVEAIEKVLEGEGTLTPSVRSWIAAQTGGFVKLAIFVAKAISHEGIANPTLSNVVASDLVVTELKRFAGAGEGAVDWLGALSLFKTIRVVPDAQGVSDYEALASAVGIGILDANRVLDEARKEGIVSVAGDVIFVTPDLLALWLSQRFVATQGFTFRPRLASLSTRLKQALAEQFSRLGDSELGTGFAASLLAATGPFGDLLTERQPWAGEVILALGTAARDAATLRVKEFAREDGAAQRIATEWPLQRLLFRLMWRPERFASLFSILLDVFEAAGCPSSGPLAELVDGMLQARVASTATPFPRVLELVKVHSGRRPVHVRAALLRSIGSGLFASSGAAYSEGDVEGPSRDYWRPESRDAAHHSLLEAVKFIEQGLSDESPEVRKAAATFFVGHGRELVREGLGERYLSLLPKVVEIDGRLGEVDRELEAILRFDSPAGLLDELHAARKALAKSLPDKVRLLTEGWSVVTTAPESGLADSVADEILSADEDRFREALELLFEPWARNLQPLMAALARHPQVYRAMGSILDIARKREMSWQPALLLAFCRDFSPSVYSALTLQMLTAKYPIDRSAGAMALTMSVASADELKALVAGIASHELQPEWLRYAQMGKWTDGNEAKNNADLMSALADREGGAGIAVSIAFRTNESKQEISDEVYVRVLGLSVCWVSGHDAWTWEQLGLAVARRSPESLFPAVLAEVTKRGLSSSDDEIVHVLEACCEQAPHLAVQILATWGAQRAMLTYKLGELVAQYVPASNLIEWAGPDETKQGALGRMVPAIPVEPTLSLMSEFTFESAFASALGAKFGSGGWSGPIVGYYESKAKTAQQWADDSSLPNQFREWARQRAQAFSAAAVTEARKALEEAAEER